MSKEKEYGVEIIYEGFVTHIVTAENEEEAREKAEALLPEDKREIKDTYVFEM